MIPVRAFAGRKVAVFGLGKSGIAAARALTAGGADVLAWDDSEANRAGAVEAGLTVDDITRRDWSGLAALVLSPGVPFTHPEPHRVVRLAKLTGTPVLGDIELFALAQAEAADAIRPKVIGVTGTNGKSTTTALIGHILQAAGRDAPVGGNIGVAALDLSAFHAGATYVLELSSFQLDLTSTLKPDVGVLLNITPDHLDRHGSMDGYVAAKKRLFMNMRPRDVAVIGVDDPITAKINAAMMGVEGGPRLAPISSGRALGRGVHAVGGLLYDAIDGRVELVGDLNRARALHGRHNWQNAAAAYAAVRSVGLDPKRAVDGLMSFKGLPHRMELIARSGRVRFVNDSKATNAASVRPALATYEHIFWIAGGRAKGDGLADLMALMPRVAKAYLIGEAAERFAAELKGRTVIEISRTLEAAVAAAARDAAAADVADPVVLLSPACASYDQFRDFEARGEAFRSLVLARPDVEAGQAA